MKPYMMRAAVMMCLVGVLTGCGKKEVAEPAAPEPTATPIPEFTYTDTPTLDMIGGEVRGEVDGVAFNPVTMYIEPGLSGWTLKVLEKELDSPEDIFMDDSGALTLEFAKAPAAGQTYDHPMEFSDELNGYFLVKGTEDYNGDGEPDYEIWNSENAYVVEITDWELAPFNPEASDFQVAGKTSGKFALCVPASSSHPASWVAGTFTDIPVRYSGEPSW